MAQSVLHLTTTCVHLSTLLLFGSCSWDAESCNINFFLDSACYNTGKHIRAESIPVLFARKSSISALFSMIWKCSRYRASNGLALRSCHHCLANFSIFGRSSGILKGLEIESSMPAACAAAICSLLAFLALLVLLLQGKTIDIRRDRNDRYV